MTEALLGIDVGTTFCKASVVTLDGRERAHGRVPTPWSRRGGRTEIDPRALFDAALAAGREAVAASGVERLVGVGVTSMAETGVLIDAAGNPVAPAIAWHDPRGEEEGASLVATFGERFTETTGLPATRLCSASKYGWLRRNEPAAAAGVR